MSRVANHEMVEAQGFVSPMPWGGASPARIMGSFPLPYRHKWNVNNLPVNRTELVQWMRTEIHEVGPKKKTYTWLLATLALPHHQPTPTVSQGSVGGVY